jgi:hypothetical protein
MFIVNMCICMHICAYIVWTNRNVCICCVTSGKTVELKSVQTSEAIFYLTNMSKFTQTIHSQLHTTKLQYLFQKITPAGFEPTIACSSNATASRCHGQLVQLFWPTNICTYVHSAHLTNYLDCFKGVFTRNTNLVLYDTKLCRRYNTNREASMSLILSHDTNFVSHDTNFMSHNTNFVLYDTKFVLYDTKFVLYDTNYVRVSRKKTLLHLRRFWDLCRSKIPVASFSPLSVSSNNFLLFLTSEIHRNLRRMLKKTGEFFSAGLQPILCSKERFRWAL